MAKKKITGITIEINGDTTKLDKAMTAVDKHSKTTQAALKEVNKLLKLDPTNTELLQQKQALLAKSVKETTSKYDMLKQAVDTATPDDALYEQWISKEKSLQGALTQTTKEVRELENQVAQMEDLGFAPDPAFLGRYQAELDEARERVESLQKQLVDTYEEMGRPIPVDEYAALKRELIDVEQQAEAAQKSLDGFSEKTAAFSASVSELSGGAQKVSDAFAPASQAIAAVGVAALATVPATDDFRARLSMLETDATAANVSLDTTNEALRRFNAISGDTDASVEAVSNLLQAGFDDNTMLDALDQIAGAVIAFPDTLKIESLADSLQETLATGEATGQFGELLDRLGVNLDDFNANLGRARTQEEKQMYAMQELSRNGLGELTQSWVANNQELIKNRDSTLEFQRASARLAETILPLMTSLTDMASGLVDWFTQLPDGVQKSIIVVAALIALISPVAGIIASIATAMGGFATASAAAAAGGAAVSMTLGGWLIVIAAVVAAVAGLIALLNILFGKKDQVENMDVDGLTSDSGTKVKGVRGYATGGVFEPNSPMLGILGDNKHEREVAAPESMLRGLLNDAVAAGGGSRGPTQVNIRFTGSLAQLGRVLQPVVSTEESRQGPSITPRR